MSKRGPSRITSSRAATEVRSRLRKLSEEEIELWTSVAASVTRRTGAALPERDQPPIVAAPPEAPPPESPRAPTADPYRPPVSGRGDALPPLAPLERRLKQKLSRGRMTADAAIDLHGFRQNEALSALRHFLHRAQGEGCRVVLVVTGKGGRPGTARDPYDYGGGDIGVLKRQVPLWLAMPDLRMIVVGYEEAGRAHGGGGALYVRLRRP